MGGLRVEALEPLDLWVIAIGRQLNELVESCNRCIVLID